MVSRGKELSLLARPRQGSESNSAMYWSLDLTAKLLRSGFLVYKMGIRFVGKVR